MSSNEFSFLKKRSISDQANYVADFLPDDETFEGKIIANTNIRKILEVFGVQLKKLEEFINLFTIETDPSCAENLLEEWERMLGIPDDCYLVENETLEDRQRNALIKLSKMSVQTNQDFENLANSFGITATVQSGIDFVNAGGTPFGGGDTEARFTVVITFEEAPDQVFPLTFPILFGSSILGILECVFRKVLPANCNAKFIVNIPEALGDFHWPMGESSGDLVDSVSGVYDLGQQGFPTYSQASLRGDASGNSVLYDSFFFQAHRNAVMPIPYSAGFTVECIVRPTSFAKSRENQFTGNYDGNIGYAISSKANSFSNSSWTMRFDNWHDVAGNLTEAFPTFTLLNRSLYGWNSQYATGVAAEVRGIAPVVLSNTYHLMATIRASNNTIEFWVNGVSIGTDTFPAVWYDYSSGTIDGDSLSLTDGSRLTVIQAGLDVSDTLNTTGGTNVQDIKIHLLEANDAFAVRQASFANFT